jgi:hypothetical protein
MSQRSMNSSYFGLLTVYPEAGFWESQSALAHAAAHCQTHAWDVFGAMKAGWHAAFVARHGMPLFPIGAKPDIIGPDMKAVTDAALLR